jgi:hypothetical protein
MLMLSYLLPALSGGLAGAVTGLLAAHRLHRRRKADQPTPQPLPPDARLVSDISRAASTWATANGRPEASGLVADKLHLLHRLGSRRGWFR